MRLGANSPGTEERSVGQDHVEGIPRESVDLAIHTWVEA